MWAMLNGKKSYLCALVGLIVVGTHAMGWITDEQKIFFLELVGAGGLMALRSAIGK